MAEAFPALFLVVLAGGVATFVRSLRSEWDRVILALQGRLAATPVAPAGPEEIWVSRHDLPALKPVLISICRI
jgi:hypothetical protein